MAAELTLLASALLSRRVENHVYSFCAKPSCMGIFSFAETPGGRRSRGRKSCISATIGRPRVNNVCYRGLGFYKPVVSNTS